MAGCDCCNAYRLKLLQPKGKTPDREADDAADPIGIIAFDTFGKVSVPSAQYMWILGSKDVSADTIAGLYRRMEAMLGGWFPGAKIKFLHMDSFSSNMSETMLKALEQGLVHPLFSPPGQHAYLQGAERYWYILVVRALVLMRHGQAPSNMWFQ